MVGDIKGTGRNIIRQLCQDITRGTSQMVFTR